MTSLHPSLTIVPMEQPTQTPTRDHFWRVTTTWRSGAEQTATKHLFMAEAYHHGRHAACLAQVETVEIVAPDGVVHAHCGPNRIWKNLTTQMQEYAARDDGEPSASGRTEEL